MKDYLVGFSYHEPEDLALWQKGVTEDFESSTGLFVLAATEEDAIAWCEQVATEFFRQLNPQEAKTWKDFDHHCWIEEDPKNSSWNHCLGFFQHVAVGQMPDFANMGTPAYVEWEKRNKEKT